MSEQLKGLVEKANREANRMQPNPDGYSLNPTAHLLRKLATALQSLMEEKERLEGIIADERGHEAGTEAALGNETLRLSHAEAVVRELVRVRDARDKLDAIRSSSWTRNDSNLLSANNREFRDAWQSARTFLAEQDKQPGDSASASVGGLTGAEATALIEGLRAENKTVRDGFAREFASNGQLQHDIEEMRLRARRAEGLLVESRKRIPDWSTGVNDDLLSRIDAALASSQGTPQDVSPPNSPPAVSGESDE